MRDIETELAAMTAAHDELAHKHAEMCDRCAVLEKIIADARTEFYRDGSDRAAANRMLDVLNRKAAGIETEGDAK